VDGPFGAWFMRERVRQEEACGDRIRGVWINEVQRDDCQCQNKRCNPRMS
jgi:hypothetical protein